MKLKVNDIRIDGGTQSRVKIDIAYVEELAEAAKARTTLPPVVVFHDGKSYWLADGFHRYHAHRSAGIATIPADLRKGTVRDAILFSVGANASHGLRRTNADKRCAVETLLKDKEWGGKSNRWIADQCGVSDVFVGDLRRQVQTVSTCDDQKRAGKDGKSYPAKAAAKPEINIDDIPMDDGPAIEETPIDTATPVSAEPVKDEVGNPITDMEIISLFNRRRELENLARMVSDVKSAVMRSVDTKDELFAEFNITQMQADCNNVYRAIKFAIPYAVCPYCKGQGRITKACKACIGKGWVGKAKWTSAPEEMRK
jgi:hypothetical protein